MSVERVLVARYPYIGEYVQGSNDFFSDIRQYTFVLFSAENTGTALSDYKFGALKGRMGDYHSNWDEQQFHPLSSKDYLRLQNRAN